MVPIHSSQSTDVSHRPKKLDAVVDERSHRSRSNGFLEQVSVGESVDVENRAAGERGQHDQNREIADVFKLITYPS